MSKTNDDDWYPYWFIRFNCNLPGYLLAYFLSQHLVVAIVLWLSGGPGCSSIGQGAFEEHGPFKPTRKGNFVANQYSWNNEANMLYFDSSATVGVDYLMLAAFW
ncbi:hypothetical protein P8452_17990 [Trifolium repens]|nr:hypothetical protein P8452_17990 [Trifolium repens]